VNVSFSDNAGNEFRPSKVVLSSIRNHIIISSKILNGFFLEDVESMTHSLDWIW
jgi:hypothetical protein